MVAGFRAAAEVFLAVEVMFPEEVAISLQVREAFREAATVSLAVAVSPGVAVFLVLAAAAFPAAATVLIGGAVAVPLDRTSVFRTILHCFPISADRGRVAVEYHRVPPEVNQATDADRWEEARHSCLLAIDLVATRQVGPRSLPLAMKAEHVQTR